MVWIGSIWLRIGTSGGLLWALRWTFGLHKMLGGSWVAAQMAALKKGSAPWVSEWDEIDSYAVSPSISRTLLPRHCPSSPLILRIKKLNVLWQWQNECVRNFTPCAHFETCVILFELIFLEGHTCHTGFTNMLTLHYPTSSFFKIYPLFICLLATARRPKGGREIYVSVRTMAW
jgi:hypothetical protein